MKMWQTAAYGDWPNELDVVRETKCFIVIERTNFSGVRSERKISKDNVYKTLAGALLAKRGEITARIESFRHALQYEEKKLAAFLAKIEEECGECT